MTEPDQPAPPKKPSPVPPGKIRSMRPKSRRVNRGITTGDEMAVGQMRGVGMTPPKIAQALGMAESSVRRILERPHIAEFASRLREATKPIVMTNIHHAAIAAGEWMQETIKDRDPKAFDAVTRGFYALERTAASASGETRPQVQVAVVNQQVESEESKALIRALMGASATDSR